MNYKELEKLVRYLCLLQTYNANSGHLTSSLSAVEICLALLLSGEFVYDVNAPKNIYNDQLLFSKAHASPLYYSIWYLLNELTINELKTFRSIDSKLEGHPTNLFEHTVAPMGSLGQGLGIGAGLAMASKKKGLNNRVFVLMGDGELTEGSNYEALQWASDQNLNNLVALVDVNRLEQVGETIYEWDLRTIRRRFRSFGWDTKLVWDGNNTKKCLNAISKLKYNRPTAILFKTKKGAGISFLENELNWHGKALNAERQQKALNEIEPINLNLRLNLPKPEKNMVIEKHATLFETKDLAIKPNMQIRDAYGEQLKNLTSQNSDLIVLDAAVGNSTRSDKAHPDNFINMNIAEQNMVSVATGMSLAGYNVISSTFASFLTRAHDQIRMAQYSNANITFVGSHVGSSIGKDGYSQMGLEDIAMFRSMLNTTIVNPSDIVSMAKLLPTLVNLKGIKYIRSTRAQTKTIYSLNEQFKIGDFKVPIKHSNDTVAIITSGITLHNAIEAEQMLANNNINIRLIDLYTLKPLNSIKLKTELLNISKIVTIEDHFIDGGIGDIINKIFINECKTITNIGINKIPRSGSADNVMKYVGIDKTKIVEAVVKLNSMKQKTQ